MTRFSKGPNTYIVHTRPKGNDLGTTLRPKYIPLTYTDPLSSFISQEHRNAPKPLLPRLLFLVLVSRWITDVQLKSLRQLPAPWSAFPPTKTSAKRVAWASSESSAQRGAVPGPRK